MEQAEEGWRMLADYFRLVMLARLRSHASLLGVDKLSRICSEQHPAEYAKFLPTPQSSKRKSFILRFF